LRNIVKMKTIEIPTFEVKELNEKETYLMGIIDEAMDYLSGFPDKGDCARAKHLSKEARKYYKNNREQLSVLSPKLNELEEEVGFERLSR